jgi:ribosomal protein S18 acetylase RimI-like enzyme
VDEPRPASAAPPDELLELVQSVRRELLLREEAPAGDWVERSAGELKAGRQLGWYLPLADGGGLAFLATRNHDAFGHVHVTSGPGALDRGRRLALRLLEATPASMNTVAVGFTGLAIEDERALLTELARRPGSIVIERRAMERGLSSQDEAPGGPAPEGLQFVPVRGVTMDALADLDVRAFTGTMDALLIGSDPRHYEEVIRTLLDGQLGRFLDEASTALYQPDPPRLVAALLTTEQSARRAIFVDFMVDPAFRQRGIGNFLLRWGFRALWALGYERVRLWVSVANEAALRLYEANGFRATAAAMIYRWERPEGDEQPHAGR